MNHAALFAIGAFAGSLCGAPIVISWLKTRGVLDVPNGRSSHVVATPRGLGIALCGSVVSTSLTAVLVIDGARNLAIVSAAALGFAVVGLVEDIWGIDPKLRIVLQVLLAGSAMGVAVGIPTSTLAVVASVIGVFGVVAYVNAVNFMDGVNGISALHGIVVGLVWCLAGWRTPGTGFAAVGLLIAAGCAGYLPWNFPIARGFLGDVGSYFLGAWLGVGAIVGLQAQIAPALVLAPLSIYLLDTGSTLMRRVARKESLLTAHRGHVYQQLVRLGWSHGRSAGFVAALTIATTLLVSIQTWAGWSMAAVLGALYLSSPLGVRVYLQNTTGSRVVALRPLAVEPVDLGRETVERDLAFDKRSA